MAVSGVRRRERISCIILFSFPLNACSPQSGHFRAEGEKGCRGPPPTDASKSSFGIAFSVSAHATLCAPSGLWHRDKQEQASSLSKASTWRPRPRELLVLPDVPSSTRPAPRGTGLRLSRGESSARHCEPPPASPSSPLAPAQAEYLQCTAVQSDGNVVTQFLDKTCTGWLGLETVASSSNKAARGAPGFRPLCESRLPLRPRGSKKYHFVTIHSRGTGSARSCSSAVIRFPGHTTSTRNPGAPTNTDSSAAGSLGVTVRAGRQAGKRGARHGETYSRGRGAVHEAIEASAIRPAG